QALSLGRATYSDVPVPWDPMISRQHAEVVLDQGELSVRRLDSARNPIYYRGQPVAEARLSDGEEFRIGNTVFRLVGAVPDESVSSAVEEISYRDDILHRVQFRNADRWLELLTTLPDMIAHSRSDEEFAQELVRLLLDAIRRCNTAAVMVYEGPPMTGAAVGGTATGGSARSAQPRILRWDSRMTDLSGFRPSRSLMMTALSRRESVLHVWNTEESNQRFTYVGRFDWAFCVPIREDACRGWCLYISGAAGEDAGLPTVVSGEELKEELRFTELLAQFIGAIRQVRMLEHQERRLSQFFSPMVREAIAQRGTAELLDPREADITVLFCDVYGGPDESFHGDLHAVLDRVSAALGIITRTIFRHNGVVADFQGDAALGFWGWPVESADGPLAACRAALEIQDEFQRLYPDANPLGGGFRIGIGIASGEAIAGKIGTDDQAKIGVFGPVVNLGSRLLGLTRTLRAPIVMGETTAAFVREYLSADEGRARRLGRLRPRGMDEAVEVSQLLPPAQACPEIADDNIREFEAAVDAVAAGRWPEAIEMLDHLPVSDRTKDFMMLFIATNNYVPPREWDGVFTVLTK
ncbi:MAG TPA: adenylate/guanylate cyclase domain-containing protein, partial [Planctomycetaceae bacterium]|nr:adenylate/guanylate cyclase domain-containing protein [Planctomycetaceae bacterium]